MKQIIDFGIQGCGFQWRTVNRDVGGSDQHVPVPGNREDESAVAGCGDHQRGLAGQKPGRQDDVRALAGCDQRAGVAIVEPSQRIAERAGGVDDTASAQLLFAS